MALICLNKDRVDYYLPLPVNESSLKKIAMHRSQTVKTSAWIVLLITLLSLSACSQASPRKEVIVFAASSLTDSFSDIEEAFELLHPEIDLLLNFASSTALLTQIRDSGQADVFASADLAHMQALLDANLIFAEHAHIFAQNELLVALASDSARVKTLHDLADPELRIVLALPEVPAGAYALQALDALKNEHGVDFEQSVIDNVVSQEDNVRQVLLKVELGEADAGFVYRTDAQRSKDVQMLSLPEFSRPEILYSIGLLNSASNNNEAQSFMTFVLSEEGQALLQSRGFLSPGASNPFSGSQ